MSLLVFLWRNGVDLWGWWGVRVSLFPLFEIVITSTPENLMDKSSNVIKKCSYKMFPCMGREVPGVE